MMRFAHRLLFLLILAATPFGQPVFAAQPATLQNNPGAETLRNPTRWIVRFHSIPSKSTESREGLQQALLNHYGLVPMRWLGQIDAWVFETPAGMAPGMLEALQTDPSVAWLEPDGLVWASDITPNDPYYQPQQSNLRLIGMPQAWEKARGTMAWPMAILDTGIDLDHPDLAGKLWRNPGEIAGNGLDDDGNGYIDDFHGWNFIGDNGLPQDDHSHGSHVAGIAAAAGNNGKGIAGMAWNTPLMAVKVLNSSAAGNASDVAAGILYAADNGARIINLSLGDKDEHQAISEAVIYAHQKGCLVAAAAGNNASAVEYPAAQPEALAVGSTTALDNPAYFSNRGPELDLVAPGMDIFSANRSGGYYKNSGTSTSTPQVSGLAALVWGLRPEWTSVQVTYVLTSTAKEAWSPGRDPLTGWGRIEAALAVDAALYRYYYPLIGTPK